MRVTVVGGGFSGLSAARALEDATVEVRLVERQNRIGGRALAFRHPRSGSFLGDAGPARFPPGCRRVARLARRLGLHLRPFYPETGVMVGFFEGRRIVPFEPAAGQFWGYQGQSSFPRRVGRYVRARIRRIRGHALPDTTFKIVGGTGALADACASELSIEPELDAQLTAVRQTASSVRLTVEGESGPWELQTDFTILALPLSILSRVDFEPELPPLNRELIDRIPFESAFRASLLMDRPFWRDSGLNGFGISDLVGEIWNPGFDEEGEVPRLITYAKGALARRLCSMTKSDVIEYLVDAVNKAMPGATRSFMNAQTLCWDQQPWIRGGWPLARGIDEDELKAFRKGCGRLAFAGDFAATPQWLNTVEGALESGVHAAGLILTRHGAP